VLHAYGFYSDGVRVDCTWYRELVRCGSAFALDNLVHINSSNHHCNTSITMEALLMRKYKYKGTFLAVALLTIAAMVFGAPQNIINALGVLTILVLLWAIDWKKI